MKVLSLSREVAIMAQSWTEALAVTPEDVSDLWEQAIERLTEETILSLSAHTPRDLPVELYANDGLLALWLGPTRLARLERPR